MKKAFVLLCLAMLLLPLPGMLRADWRDREQVEQSASLRGEMTALHAYLSRGIGMSGSDQVALGRRGVLYLAETLPSAAGLDRWTEEETAQAAAYLQALDGMLKARGAYLVFLCAPNKASVMPQDLPPYVRPSDESNLDRLLARLKETDVRFVDVKELLAGDDAPYLRTDTHWTDQTACRVYRALMDCLPAAEKTAYRETETVRITGDLSELIYPQNAPEEETERRIVPRTYRAVSRMRSVMDLHLETECRRNGLQVVMLRDSFANALFPYLANNIGHVYLHRADRWEEAYWRDGTQAVILEIAERNLDKLLEEGR